MTLTDFLLARIDDDEAAASRAGSFAPWSEPFQIDNYGHLTVQPDRVLADCEAKRQLVEDWQMHAQQEGPEARTVARVLLSALCVLAVPYADHPDYDESWRP